MIPCPSCGTHNRRGSKYCYRCGQRVDMDFDVSCPACDRLNPGGSVFCAFCGAKISSPLLSEETAIAGQAVPMTQEPLGSELVSAEPIATSQHELPRWLYEQPIEHPEAAALPSDAPPIATAEPAPEQSKYLNDIAGALPQTQGWLSSAPKLERKRAVEAAPPSKTKAQAGCLTLALFALLGAVALVLLSGM